MRRSIQREKVIQILQLLGHGELHPETPVGELSVGAQQLVEIARALVMQAKLIVFDEPTSSLAQHDVEKLFEVIGKLKEKNIGIVYISHFLEEIAEICDQYTVLRDGEVVGSDQVEGTSEEEIISLMVGRNVDDLYPAVEHSPGEPILSLKNLSGVKLPKNIDFEIRRGEIFGIAGLVGAGAYRIVASDLWVGSDPKWHHSYRGSRCGGRFST